MTHGWSGRRVLVFLAALACALLGTARITENGTSLASAEIPSEGYVLVQYAVPEQRQLPDDPAQQPTLEEQGYRTLAVPEGMTRDEFLAQLRNDPAVVSAQEDVAVFAQDLPDDPYYDWFQAPYMELMGAPGGWSVMNASPEIVVAVLDSGIDLNHPEFVGRIWENTADADNDGVDDDGNGCIDDRFGCRMVSLTPTNRLDSGCGYKEGSSVATGNVMDDHGRPGGGDSSHGTLVSGMLGAAGNNGIGMAGAAWNVKIMPVKVLDCGAFAAPEGRMSDIIRGIEYATRNGAKVINISIASSPGDQSADSPNLRKAISDAQAAGVIVVAAAGNQSTPTTAVGPGYPAAYTQFENVVAVGASTQDGQPARYTNAGPALDLAAPGNGIVGTLRSDLGNQTPYGQVDLEFGGTSYATPLVSGLFALMRARNPSLSVTEYVEAAKAGATPAPPAPHGQNWAGAGIVNYANSLNRIPMVVTGSALHDWKDVPAGTDVRAYIDGIECGSTTTFSLGPASRYDLKVRSSGQQAGCGAPGKTVSLTVDGQPAQPTFTWGGQNQSLTLRSRDVSSVSPPPGDIVVQTLNDGWSNIAVLDAGGPLPAALADLSSAWTSVFWWDPGKDFLNGEGAFRHFYRNVPGYVNDLQSVQRYEAYWIDGSAANIASLNPAPAPGRTVQLQPGWNNVVWTGHAAETGPALAQIAGKYTHVLHYDNATESWLTFIPGQNRALQGFNGLFQFKAYWIYATETVSLVMP